MLPLDYTHGDYEMFLVVLGSAAFLGAILAASLCVIAGHADNMLEDIEQEMKGKSLEALFDKERVG